MPKNSKKSEIVTGAFVLVAVLLTATMIVVFGSFESMFDTTHTVRIQFQHVGDLRLRAPVKMGGVTIGRVSDIQLKKFSKIHVTAEIQEGVFLHEDPKAFISTSGLVGDTFVEFSPGTVGAFPWEAAETKFIQGQSQPSTTELLVKVSEIGDDVSGLLEHITSVIGDDGFKKNLLETAENTNQLTRQAGELVEDLKVTSGNINKASEDVVETIEMVKAMTADVREAVLNKRNIGAIQDTIENLRTISGDATEMTGNMKNILARLDTLSEEEEPVLRQAIEDIGAIATNLRETLEKISTDEGVLSYFTTDRLTTRVDQLLTVVESPIKRIGAILETTSKVDLMRAYIEGRQLAKKRLRELEGEGKTTVDAMLKAEYEREQRIIERWEALQQRAEDDVLGEDGDTPDR